MPAFGNEKTEHHRQYLNEFWSEEPEFKDFSGNQKNRWAISRKTVRGYLSKINPEATVDHKSIAISKYLSRLLSGYVHAAAPQLHELFDPEKSRFRLSGYTDSPLRLDHQNDFENQFFRGVISVFVVAKLIEADEVVKDAYELHSQLKKFFGG